ncbi:MAG: BPSS1187 family protein [Verrucomicrobiia bacterium]|jgi:hypothetical protein
MKFLFARFFLLLPVFAMAVLTVSSVEAAESAPPLIFKDAQPKMHRLSARASQLNSRAREYPKIGFIFGTDKKPQDLQRASVDTRVKPRGKLVIWLMSHNGRLFDRLNSYGIHAIQPHYANKWFSKVCRGNPVGENCRGNMRLEAATGGDYSDEAGIQKQDGMMERSLQFVKYLAKKNPEGKWDYFLTPDGKGLRWEDVIVAGSSHGSTTAARFAKHQKVSRVVMLCGPRDQLQNWQKLPSATPTERYFGFSHVLDGGWTADHYCRSWELIGLHEHGPIVNVGMARPPYGNTRRLITSADVKNDVRRAHSSVQPGGNSPKDARGGFLFEPVWKYLFTHPVERTGRATAMDPGCLKEQR